MSRNKSFDFRARFGAIYSASIYKTKSTFYRIARLGIGFVLRIRKHWNYFSNIRTGGSFYLVAISFWYSRTISQLNFEGLSTYGLLIQRLFF